MGFFSKLFGRTAETGMGIAKNVASRSIAAHEKVASRVASKISTLNSKVDVGAFTGDYNAARQKIFDSGTRNTDRIKKATESKGFFKDFARGTQKEFGKNWMNPIIAKAGLGAVAGGISGGISSAASFADPEHVQSNGIVKSAIKGALVGASVGALQVGAKSMHRMTQSVVKGSGIGHAIAESSAISSIATKPWVQGTATAGAIGMAMYGSTNIRTRSVNPIK
jgi:hypothetical protein